MGSRRSNVASMSGKVTVWGKNGRDAIEQGSLSGL